TATLETAVQRFRRSGIFPFNTNLFPDRLSETTNCQDTAASENIRRAALMEDLSLTSTETKSFLSTSKDAEIVPSISKDIELVPSSSQNIDYKSTFTFN
ncbi:unnamed protein product, partial [Heterotrigona itama]